jgi:hypothetical protein
MTKKPRKKRQLSEEQRQELRERLEKAREAKKPAKGLSINENIRNLPDTDPLSPKRVRGWIRNTQLKLKSMKSWKNSNDRKQKAAYYIEEAYLANLQNYLRTGIYLDCRWGADRQHRVSHKCVAMAYNKDGTPKRSVGTWYPDINGVYTLEMQLEDNGSRPAPKRKKRASPKRRRTKNAG